jgi:hypothetical protein
MRPPSERLALDPVAPDNLVILLRLLRFPYPPAGGGWRIIPMPVIFLLLG